MCAQQGFDLCAHAHVSVLLTQRLTQAPPLHCRVASMRGPGNAARLALPLLLLAAAAAADSSGVILAGGAVAGTTCLAQPIDFGGHYFYYRSSVSMLTVAAVASGCLR